jgi:hypothetical protein
MTAALASSSEGPALGLDDVGLTGEQPASRLIHFLPMTTAVIFRESMAVSGSVASQTTC